MKFITTRAVILQTKDANEADVIVDFLDEKGTRLRALAKHGRRSRKRFVNAFGTLSLVTLRYRHYGDRLWLEDGKLEKAFSLGDDPPLVAGLKDLVREVLLNLLPEGEGNPENFFLLLGFLNALASRQAERSVELTDIFLLRQTAISGYLPAFDRCDICGADLSSVRRWVWQLSPFRVTCATHFLSGTMKWEWDGEILSIIKSSISFPVGRLWNIRMSAFKAPVLLKNICSWLEMLISKELKSYRWILERGLKETT
ncbi:DNA repair protein RecO [Thermodesulforhabdus norvegica]|uniref:DNA repair protein RecO n=1 Tax=Thermodesulforhabdus norvegica TaxID=39841 RepID=A0A1I4RJ20_9BACT|nr:DNA repair protein RecO [Thermodesulforhabdus norvegica]SFM51930.1 DNA replication and repair protein RecO [Thermodesulforhabdus norvegica]